MKGNYLWPGACSPCVSVPLSVTEFSYAREQLSGAGELIYVLAYSKSTDSRYALARLILTTLKISPLRTGGESSWVQATKSL